MQLHTEIKQLNECIFFYRSVFTVHVLRLSIIIVNWEILLASWWLPCACAFESSSCVDLPSWFALSSLSLFAICLSPPTRLLVPWRSRIQVSSLCVRYSPQPERSVWQVSGEGGPWEVAMVTPFICILPTFTCLLPALLTIGTYPPFDRSSSDRQVNFLSIVCYYAGGLEEHIFVQN